MASVQLATQIDRDVKKKLDDFCKNTGIRINKFIEDAIVEKIEDLMDSRRLSKAVKESEGFISLDRLGRNLRKAGKL